ncbi:MAG: glucose-1-phosphate thymidylyltransferase [Duncaniella sp.]|nr:glucose-1-phosphate thymidylyltransferase [Duncaniella sp.]
MKNIILFDPADVREGLLPLTFTRPVALIRHGILTISEKWQRAIPGAYSYLTEDYLAEKFPMVESADGDDLYISGNVEPDENLVNAILALEKGSALVKDGKVLASRGALNADSKVEYEGETPLMISRPYDIFLTNNEALHRDYRLLTSGRKSKELSDTCTLIGSPTLPDGTPALFIEEGATVEGAFINVKNGPVYIGRDAEVMEGSCLRGPIALCEHGVINMGSKIYGGTTIGPYCKVGGEINNAVIFGYSNKAHDGFLGNAVIGEWCNLGAGCTMSNLKNTYAPIRLWNYTTSSFEKTKLQFCGLITGDHCKAGINTMFNTATVLGVGVNFYSAGFPRTYIPSFSEGTVQGMKPVDMNRFFETAERMMSRRHVSLTPIDKEILISIRENTPV